MVVVAQIAAKLRPLCPGRRAKIKKKKKKKKKNRKKEKKEEKGEKDKELRA
jgi:hypothetical protein